MNSLMRILVFSAGYFFSLATFGQFVIPIGGTQADSGRAVAIDSIDNYFIAGSFRQTVDFDPGPGVANLTTASGATYLASYDSSGAYRFAIPLGSTSGSGPKERALAIDSTGNVFITGWFTGSADFDPGPGTATLTSSTGNLFLASYDNTGNFRFAFNLGGDDISRIEMGTALAVDSADNVYITGTYPGEMDFDPDGGEALLEVEGITDIFLASYTNTGNYRFAISMGGTGGDQGNGLALDNSGNIYVTGYFSGTADFDPSLSDALLISNGSNDIFLASYDSAGNYLFAESFGSSGDDRGLAIASTDTGTTFITGFFSGVVDFDPGTDTQNLDALAGDDIMLASYDSNGQYQFAFSLGNGSDASGRSLVLDSVGNVILTGDFSSTLDVDPGAGSLLLGNSGIHALTAKYSSLGDLVDAYIYEGIAGDNAFGFSVALNSEGLPAVVGDFSGDVDFDPGAGSLQVTSSAGGSAYLSTNTNFSPIATEVDIPLVPIGYLALLAVLFLIYSNNSRRKKIESINIGKQDRAIAA